MNAGCYEGLDGANSVRYVYISMRKPVSVRAINTFIIIIIIIGRTAVLATGRPDQENVRGFRL